MNTHTKFAVRVFRGLLPKTNIARIFLIVVLVLASSATLSNSTSEAANFPYLKFPWDSGHYKIWTTGLHGSDTSYWSIKPLSQLYSLDFGGYFDVLAAGSGIVEDASGVRGCGPFGIRIRHNDNYKTEYCHLSSRSVNIGQWVPQGRKIGTTGRYGCGSCGTHLHFSLIKNGRYETWDDKIIDGWRFHAVHYASGGLIYGQGTATFITTGYWYKFSGWMSDGYGRGNVQAWVGPRSLTRVSSAYLRINSGPYRGTVYNSVSDYSFRSSNYRR